MLKKLNKKRTEKAIDILCYKNKYADLIRASVALKPNESLILPNEDWHTKTSPRHYIPSFTNEYKRPGYEKSRLGKVMIGRKYSVKRLKDQSGWLVLRKK